MTELEILQMIRANPALYLGRRAVTPLFHYVGGFIHGAKAISGVMISNDISAAMQEFVRQWYDIPGHFHWSSILLMVCQSEEAAFNKFFELLDLYLKGVDPVEKK